LFGVRSLQLNEHKLSNGRARLKKNLLISLLEYSQDERKVFFAVFCVSSLSMRNLGKTIQSIDPEEQIPQSGFRTDMMLFRYG
jgi:hypothetical protein